MQADDAEDTDTDHDEADPGHPEDKATEQLAGGWQCSLTKKLGSTSIFRKSIETSDSQDAANDNLQQPGNEPTDEDNDERHHQARQKLRDVAYDFLSCKPQFEDEFFPHRTSLPAVPHFC